MPDLKLIPLSQKLRKVSYRERRHIRHAEACENCMFFRRPASSPSSEHGECRIDPPTLTELGRGLVTMWPSTRTDDWCGEYQRDRKRRVKT